MSQSYTGWHCVSTELEHWVAISANGLVVLHPSMRLNYLKVAKWEPDWIENAVDIAVACWKEHYRPEDSGSDEQESATTSQFGYSVSELTIFTSSTYYLPPDVSRSDVYDCVV